MSTKINIEVDEKTLKRLVVDHLNTLVQENLFTTDTLNFEVITTENYRAEKWELGRFRVTATKFDAE